MANLDTLQIEIKANATDASQAIKGLESALKSLNRQLGLKDGTKLVKVLESLTNSANSFSASINKADGGGLDKVAQGAQSAQKAVQQLAKEGEDLQKVLDGFKTADFDKYFGVSNSKKRILGEDAANGSHKITETGFTIPNWDDSAPQRVADTVQEKLLPAVIKTQEKTESLQKQWEGFHIPDLGTGLPEAFEKTAQEANKASSAIQQAYKDLRNFKKIMSDMESGKVPFFEDIYADAYRGAANAQKEIDAFKKSLEGGEKPTFMGTLIPQMERLSGSLKKVSAELDEMAEKGIHLFEKMLIPLKMAAGEYVEKFEKMKESVSDFVKHFKASMAKVSAFWKRTMKTFTFMLVRKAITAIIKEVGNAIQSLAMYSNAMGTMFNKDLSSMVADFQYLGRSIVSVFAPLLSVVAPIIDAIVDKIATLLSYIGMLFAALGGSSSFTKAKKNVGNYAESLDKASKSAKNLTMGIDELNILSENQGGGSSNPYDGWEDAWENVEIPDWIKNLADKIKGIFKDLFEPIKKAWEKAKKYVLDGWKYMTEQMKKLLSDVWRDFIRVWKSDTVVHIFYNLFMIIGDIERVVGNLAKNFDEAWNSGEKGYLILKNIAEIVDILVQHVRNVTFYMVDWSAGIDFNPLLESVVTFTDALKDLADFLGGVFEDVMKNVVLKYIKWMIEEGTPHLLHRISEIIESFDFEKIRQGLVPLEEAFERLLENVHTGITNGLGNIGEMIGQFTSSDEFIAFLSRIAEIMDLISAEDIEKLLTGIGKGVLDIANAIVKFVNSDLFMAFLKALDEWLENATSDDIANVLKSVAIAIGLFKFGSFASKGFGNFLEFLLTLKSAKDLLDSVKGFEGVGKAISSIGGALKTIGGIGMVISGAVMAIKNFFDMWFNGWNVLDEVLKDVGIAIAAIGAVLLGVAAAPAAIVAAIVAALSTLVIVIHDHWEEICQFFQETLPAWWEGTALPWLQNLPSAIVEFLVTMWENIKTWASEIIPAIAAWLETVKTSVSEKLTVFIDSVVTFFSELPGKIGYALGFVLGTLVSWAASLVTWIIENVPIIIENIVTFFKELPGKIWEWLVEVVNKFVEWGAEVVAWIAENVSQFIENIVAFFQELPGKIWELLLEVVAKFTEWKTSATEWISTNIPLIVESFINFFKEIPQKLYDLGTDIVSGLINGVKNAWEGLKSGVADFCGGFIQGFKDAFQIHSPSKETENIGDYLMQGLFKPFLDANVDTIRVFANNIITVFKQELSSDKFTAIGKQMVTGILQPINTSSSVFVTAVRNIFIKITEAVRMNMQTLGVSVMNLMQTFSQTYIFPFFNTDLWSPLFENLLSAVFVPFFENFRTWFIDDAMSPWWEEDLLSWFDNGKWDEEIFEPLKENIQNHWETFSSWWDTTMSEWWENQVKPWFEKDLWKEQLNNILEITKEVFDLIVEAIAERMEEASEAVAESCQTMIESLEQVATKIDEMLDKLKGFDGFNGKVTFDFGAKKFASGGFPSRGSLFWAGEGNGVEMVGSIGGRTGVVSHDEITGIADAVYATGNTESELLAQLLQIGQAMLNKDPIVLSDKDIARMNNSGQNKLGMSIIS